MTSPPSASARPSAHPTAWPHPPMPTTPALAHAHLPHAKASTRPHAAAPSRFAAAHAAIGPPSFSPRGRHAIGPTQARHCARPRDVRRAAPDAGTRTANLAAFEPPRPTGRIVTAPAGSRSGSGSPPNRRASSSWLTNCPGGSTRSCGWRGGRQRRSLSGRITEPHVKSGGWLGASRDPSSRVHRVGTGRSASWRRHYSLSVHPRGSRRPSEAVPTGRARKNLQKLSGSHWRVWSVSP